MNIEGIFIGSTFMMLVGSFIFMIIGNLPKGLRLLAKGLLILGGVMMVLPVIIDYYLPNFEVFKFARVLSYTALHLGTITIIFGKIFVAFKDVKYRNSKWELMNYQPLFIYMLAYVATQLFGYGLNIDPLKEVIITESSTQTSPFGLPFIVSLFVAGGFYFSMIKKQEVS